MKNIIKTDTEQMARIITNKYNMKNIIRVLWIFEIYMIIGIGIIVIKSLMDIGNEIYSVELIANGLSMEIPNNIVNEFPKMYLVLFLIEDSIGNLLGLITIDGLRRFLSNTSKFKTPFTMKNINIMYSIGIVIGISGGLQWIISTIKYMILVNSNMVSVLENINGLKIASYSQMSSLYIIIMIVMVTLATTFKIGLEIQDDNESII